MARAPGIDISMKREALLTSPFFRHMRADELDEIIGFATERRCARGTTVFSKGDPGTSMMAVLAGRIRVSNVSSEGKEVTLNVVGPGEIFGEIALLDGKPRSADTVAAEDTTLMVVERRHFLPFIMRHESLMERMLVVLCDRLRRTSLALEEIAMFDLPARLARVLLKLAGDYGRVVPKEEGGGTRIDMKLSQRDLSTLVASSRESVNKQLRVWREGGTIDLRDGYLVVRRPEALQRLSE
jgi:CRP/FNR family transcriptional regulator, cyclic AMP receptor protein